MSQYLFPRSRTAQPQSLGNSPREAGEWPLPGGKITPGSMRAAPPSSFLNTSGQVVNVKTRWGYFHNR